MRDAQKVACDCVGLSPPMWLCVVFVEDINATRYSLCARILNRISNTLVIRKFIGEALNSNPSGILATLQWDAGLPEPSFVLNILIRIDVFCNRLASRSFRLMMFIGVFVFFSHSQQITWIAIIEYDDEILPILSLVSQLHDLWGKGKLCGGKMSVIYRQTREITLAISFDAYALSIYFGLKGHWGWKLCVHRTNQRRSRKRSTNRIYKIYISAIYTKTATNKLKLESIGLSTQKWIQYVWGGFCVYCSHGEDYAAIRKKTVECDRICWKLLSKNRTLNKIFSFPQTTYTSQKQHTQNDNHPIHPSILIRIIYSLPSW